MRSVILCVMAIVLIAGAAAAQQPRREADARIIDPPGVQPEARGTPDEEIRKLNAALSQLQEQVNRLSELRGAPASRLPKEPVSSSPLLEQPLADTLPSGTPGLISANLDDGPSWRMNAEWKNGLQISSADDAFRVHVGGTLLFDNGWNAASHQVQFGQGGIGELQDGAVFRTARIRMDGTMYQHLEWVTEFDFANNVQNDTGKTTTPIGSPSFTNVWMGLNDLPLIGTLRAGWMKEPIGFAHLSSVRSLNFMERAPGVGALSLSSPGLMLRNATEDQRVTWAFGFFHAQDTNFGFGIGDGQYAETGRLTWLPWYADDGSELLHLGVGASHRHLSNNVIELRGRPSVRTMPGTLEPALADTGTIGGSTSDGVDVELAGVLGPWTLQSEYYCVFIHDALFPNQPPPQGVPLGMLFYQGAYVELLYFLTGETRAYDRRDAVFGRVIPRRNFNIWGGEEGCGAWQVGFRYSFLDLQDKGVNGATLHDMVLGLNWFLNPNMKVQWNFAVDHRDSTPAGSSGWTYIFGSRLALDF